MFKLFLLAQVLYDSITRDELVYVQGCFAQQDIRERWHRQTDRRRQKARKTLRICESAPVGPSELELFVPWDTFKCPPARPPARVHTYLYARMTRKLVHRMKPCRTE